MRALYSCKWGWIVGSLALTALACEAEKPAEVEKPKAAAEATQTAQLAAAKTPEKPKEPEKAERPSTIDTALSAERRAAVEQAYPDAKGFVDVKALEESFKKGGKIKAKEAAIKAIDKEAKGKWILISGPMINLAEDAFELAVSYTPRDPNDVMGMSQQFVTIKLSGVEGYAKESFKAGQMVVVLAKYDGAGSASKGVELVDAGHWK